MKQIELAEISGMSVSYICLLEKNKRDPGFSVIESIANALKIPVCILLYFASDKNELVGINEEIMEKLSYEMMRAVSTNQNRDDQPLLRN